MQELVHQTTAWAGQHWVLMALAIIGFSWIWEDAAVFLAALLALDNQIPILAAAFAAFVGITSGDLALYLLGRVGYRWRWLRRWALASPKARVLRKRFRRRITANIFLIRFVPGLRTLGFTLCGLWRVPVVRFALVMAASGVIWVGFVFILINVAGMSDLVRETRWKWTLMAGAVVLLLANNYWASRMIAVDVARESQVS